MHKKQGQKQLEEENKLNALYHDISDESKLPKGIR